MSENLRRKTIKLRRQDIWVKTKGDVTAIQLMDKRDICMLTNIYEPPQEGNFHDDQGNVIKPETVEDYNHHMHYVNKDDRMADSYSINGQIWKWTEKLFFHLFNLTTLNSYIFLSSCDGKKISHRDFQLAHLRNKLEMAGQEWQLQRPVLRPSTASVNTGRLDTSFSKHWPDPSKLGHCRVCSARGVTRKVCMKCLKCDVAMCQ